MRKVRCLINQIIVEKQRDGYHPQKEALFDILSLANQLHRSKSTYPKGPERGKIYFLENQVPNLISLELNHLPQAVKEYKKAVRKDYMYDEKALDVKPGNKMVDELF